MAKTNAGVREQIIHNVGKSFSHKEYDHFTMPWHYHPEYEIIVIITGGGQRFVGNYTDEFKPGDLLIMGPNLPHYHMCNGLLNNKPDEISTCEVIQFSQDIFPQDMEKIEELSLVAGLLERSKRGVKFTSPPSIDRICKLMRHMDGLSGVKRISALLRILEMLAKSPDYKMLTSDDYSPNLIDADVSSPVNKVYRYLYENFKEEISLDEIAHKFGYNTTSLCRHYKKYAQKSIFKSLQEIRIGFACKMLSNTTLTINQIAFECGYNNMSNFNRQFLATTNLTPSAYRELYLTGV